MSAVTSFTDDASGAHHRVAERVALLVGHASGDRAVPHGRALVARRRGLPGLRDAGVFVRAAGRASSEAFQSKHEERCADEGDERGDSKTAKHAASYVMSASSAPIF